MRWQSPGDTHVAQHEHKQAPQHQDQAKSEQPGQTEAHQGAEHPPTHIPASQKLSPKHNHNRSNSNVNSHPTQSVPADIQTLLHDSQALTAVLSQEPGNAQRISFISIHQSNHISQ